MGDVRKKFLKPMLQVFSIQKTDSEDGWMAAYEMVLKTFSDETLSRAAASIIAARTTRSFPMPAECSHACRDALEMITLEQKRGDRPNNSQEIRNLPLEQRHPEWAVHRRKRADELICSDMGREALAEDWIWCLWDFCRENERLPDRHEKANVRAMGLDHAREFWEMANNDVNNKGLLDIVAGLVKLRQAAYGRFEKLIAR